MCVNPDHLMVLTAEEHYALHSKEDSAHLIGPQRPKLIARRKLACKKAVTELIVKLGEVPKLSRLAAMTGYTEYLIKKVMAF